MSGPTMPPEAQVSTIASPLNLLLFSLLLVLIYYRMRSAPVAAQSVDPASTVFKTFTPPELLAYNGSEGGPVYLAVRGQVFDVSPGRNFYGPGGPYENFAGRDASRGLACGSFDEDMLTQNLNGPLDDLNGLNDEQREALADWQARFTEKYLIVGSLAAIEQIKS